MRLVLHIGATKTGSSAFQRHCAAEAPALREAGLLYPDVGLAAGAHHLVAAAMHPTARGLHKAFFSSMDRSGPELLHQMAGEIIGAADRAGAEHILLSSEYLWGRFSDVFYEEWIAAFHGLDVEVVAIIRRQDEWAQSAYLQGVKNGLAEPFADWWARRSAQPPFGAQFDEVLRPWAERLGADAVTVLTYDDVVERGDAVRALLAALEIDDLPLAAGAPRVVNPSPAAGVVELLRTTNASSLPDAAKADIRRIVLKSGEHRPVGAPIDIIPNEEKLALLDEAKRANAYILQTFMRDGREKLFSKPWPAAKASAQPVTSFALRSRRS
ncbi:MAG: hypothetical protein AAFR11_13545 [Pseudomonadota bacterium]